VGSFESRRDFLFQSCGGISGLALASLLNQDRMLGSECATTAPVGANKPHHTPRAKSVISLFMSGGVSHVDTFDPKPMLKKYAGEPLSGKGDVVVRQGHPGPLMPSPFTFRKYGHAAWTSRKSSRRWRRMWTSLRCFDPSSASPTIMCRRTTRLRRE
jgi:hypothetical protein